MTNTNDKKIQDLDNNNNNNNEKDREKDNLINENEKNMKKSNDISTLVNKNNTKNLTAIEMEEQMLAKYEVEENIKKEKELKKKMEEINEGNGIKTKTRNIINDDDEEEGEEEEEEKENEKEEEDGEIFSDTNRHSEQTFNKRKEALRQIKKMKNPSSQKSLLQEKFNYENNNEIIETNNQNDWDEDEQEQDEIYDEDNDDGRDYKNGDNKKNSKNNFSKKLNELEKKRNALKFHIGDDGKTAEQLRAEAEEANKRLLQEKNLSMTEEEKKIQFNNQLPVKYPQFLRYLYRSRKFFEDNYFEPYFEDIVKNQFMKVAYSRTPEGNNLYRICKILYLIKGDEKYKFCGEETNYMAVVVHGDKKETRHLTHISSQALTPYEFHDWDFYMSTNGFSIISYGDAKDFYEYTFNYQKRYKYTNDDITKMTNRKKAAGLVKLKLGVEKTRLERDVKAAEYDGNFDKAAVIKARLSQVKQEHEERSRLTSDEVERINEINRRNREENMRRDREAAKAREIMNQRMTIGEKLQYVRASSDRVCYLSQEKIDIMVLEKKLRPNDDNSNTYIQTGSSSGYIIAPFPKNLNQNESQKAQAEEQERINSVNKDKNEGNDDEKKDDDEYTDLGIFSRVIEDIEKSNDQEESSYNPGEFVKYFNLNMNSIMKPKKVRTLGKIYIKLLDCDGDEIILRPKSVIKQEQKRKRDEMLKSFKRVKTGLTLQEYYEQLGPRN